MTHMVSYTKFENMVLPSFKINLSNAASTEDVKKFHRYAVRALFDHLGIEDQNIDRERVRLAPESEEGYILDGVIFANATLREAWKGSDLPRIMTRLAQSAVKRFKRLAGSPEKTEQKIYHLEGRR